MGECRRRRAEAGGSQVWCFLLSCHATFLYFFFQLGQSCCGPWRRVPRAWQRNSNMDHLTPVKTALLVERQALSACRVKCYAASQFTATPPHCRRLSKPPLSSPLSPTLAHPPSASLSLSPTSLALNLPPLHLIHLYHSSLVSPSCPDALKRPLYLCLS